MKKKGQSTKVKDIAKLIANILSWTALAILIIIAGCLIYYVVTSKIYESRGEKYEPPFSLYTIISPSMEPNIRVYDVIVDTKVTNPKSIKKGDIITFISSSSISSGFTVTHRVYDVIEDENGISFKTKGDNNLTPDSSLVPARDVLGKVIFKIPQLGRVQFLLASKSGWICLILIPALGIIIYDIMKLLNLTKVKNKVAVAVESDKVEISEEQIEKEKERKEKLKEKLNAPNKPEPKKHRDVADYVETKSKNVIVSVGRTNKPAPKTESKKEEDLVLPIKKKQEKRPVKKQAKKSNKSKQNRK